MKWLGGLSLGCVVVGLCGLAHAQTQIKPRVMLIVDTSGSMNENLSATAGVGGDGSVSYQDSQMSIAASDTSPNYSVFRGYSSANSCPPAANTTLGTTSKMYAAKQAVTNVINGSGDVDWGLSRYTGTVSAFPTSIARNSRSINPDPDISPNRNPWPVICTTSAQCPNGQTCNTTLGSTGYGRCTKQRCTTNAQCTANPSAAGRTCDMATGQCTCGSDADCGTNMLCASGECRGMGGAACSSNTQCASNNCGPHGICLCSASNQCRDSCNTATGECRCNNDNQCTTGSCDDSTDQCVVGNGNQCRSGARLGTTDQCACTSDSQCPSGSCDLGSGRCLCTANGQCRSGICRVDTGECACTSSAQCWGAAVCTATGECAAQADTDCPSGARSGSQCTCNTTTAKCLDGQTCSANQCQCVNDSDCRNGGTCSGGVCTDSCTTENDCGFGEWCLNGQCGYPNTLVSYSLYGATDTRGGTACGRHPGLRVSYAGSCGSDDDTVLRPECRTLQSCGANDPCTGAATCTSVAGNVGVCDCAGNSANCPANYTCNAQNRCEYTLGCINSGGTILVDPTAAGYTSTRILPYVDGVEIFTDNGSGQPTNPELRSVGSTPLAGATRAATAWYASIRDAAVGTALYDAKIACRPYVTVLLTDGLDTCEANNDPPGANNTGSYSLGPVAAARGFVSATRAGARFPNRVEVIALSLTDPADRTILDNIAKAGDPSRTGARYANNQSDIEAALADIVASSVLYEQCNGQDDNCNDIVDEGLGVYQECNGPGQCMVGSCATSGTSAGRCTCTGGMPNQCSPGYACNVASGSGYCVPTCTVGTGVCQRTGVRKCGGSCCVNDGQVACTPLAAGSGTTEVCNNLDDNCNGQIDEGNVCAVCQPTAETCNGKDDDCDGIIDNNLVDTNQPCGSDEGECKAGITACQPDAGFAFPHASDHIVCAGAIGPSAEICDARDNNCDGVTDGMTRACYAGPAATRGVGACRDGAQSCIASTPGVEAWGTCVGQILPTTEICNGVDDDCNGVPDDVSGSGGACCSSGRCGMGVCRAGTMQCSGGLVQCVGEVGPAQEVCDGVDNDCNGVVDDVPGLGASCNPSGSACGGTLVCNTSTMMLDCMPTAAAPEVCNGVDDDCDGLVDETPDVGNNDNRLDQPCDQPVAPADLPPCKAGNTVCQNGQVACVGAVKPEANVCGQPSRDCQTSGIFTGNCPAGFECFEGTCAAPCSTGEFPCPGGFVCQTTSSGSHLCVPDACTKITCPMGQFCQIDPQGMAVCMDPCANVSCPSGYRCKEGLCVDDSCRSFGCPDGQICVGSECQADPCFGKTCDENQYCSPSTGECVRACVGPCPSGEQCVDGMCERDPCAGKKCASGETCAVSQGVGVCVSDMCNDVGCNPGSTCCGGMCIADPCAKLSCPAGSMCQLSSSCSPYCQAEAAEKIVGAGGGGFACDYTGSRSRGTPWMFVVLFACFVGLRRRGSAARRCPARP